MIPATAPDYKEHRRSLELLSTTRNHHRSLDLHSTTRNHCRSLELHPTTRNRPWNCTRLRTINGPWNCTRLLGTITRPWNCSRLQGTIAGPWNCSQLQGTVAGPWNCSALSGTVLSNQFNQFFASSRLWGYGPARFAPSIQHYLSLSWLNRQGKYDLFRLLKSIFGLCVNNFLYFLSSSHKIT